MKSLFFKPIYRILALASILAVAAVKTFSPWAPQAGDTTPSFGAKSAGALLIATAQFPAPRTEETEQEWRNFREAYSASLRSGRPSEYSEYDAEGHPLWWGGSREAALGAELMKLLLEDKFEQVDRILATWAKNSERTADGKWKLDLYLQALASLFEEHWPRELERIERWKAKSPRSVGAAVAEAYYWRAYAWNARGDGYSNTVDDKAWEMFADRSRKAEEALRASESYASDNPLWGSIYLSLAPGLQLSQQKTEDLFRRLVQKNRFYYWYYFWMTGFSSPKWGGSWAQIESLARFAEKATAETDGASLYARIYWSAAGNNQEVVIFKTSRVDWPHMKEGFDDLMARYPHSAWNANAYASFACAADDGDTFRRMRQRIGAHIERRAWLRGRTLEFCEEKFPGRKAQL